MKHLTIFLAICLAAATVTGQVPTKMSYQGLLKTTSCTYVTDGDYDIEFKFYDQLIGGILKHTDTKNGVPVSKGVFHVILGPLPMIFNEQSFVEITVLAGPDVTMPLTFSPRNELTSSAYAFNAIHAMTANPVGPAGGDLTGNYPDPNIAPNAVTTGKILDGTILGGDIANSQVVRSLNNITDHIKLVGKDGAAITANLDTIFIHAGGGGGSGIQAVQNTDGRLAITDPTGPTATINISKSGAASGQALMYDGANVVWQTPGGGGLTLPFEGSAATADGQAAFKVTSTTATGTNYGVYGKSNSTIGIGMLGISPFVGTYGIATAITGTNYGMYGISNSTSGYGLYGYASNASGANKGVYGKSMATHGFGVYGWAEATTGTNYGVYGRSNSTLGYGVYGTSPKYGLFGSATETSGTNYGVYGVSASPSGRGVQGVSPYLGTYGRADGTSGENFGVYGKSMSTAGYGVYGTAEATSGHNYGVYGRSNSSLGTGLYGYASTGVGGVGVFGHGGNVGVWGRGGSYAGYFEGRVTVTGILSKGGGAFKIDHPLDPENKYLYHSFVESPDMMNIYNGNITLNDKGEAVVQLPDWFGALNKEFRYQLTAIGAPGPNLYIAQEVRNNSFTIAGGTSGMKISWQVTGIRKDAFAEKHRIPIEEDKKNDEKGKYLHPEAFGKSREQGVDALHSPKLPDETMLRDEMHSLPEPNIPDVMHEPPHEPKHLEDLDRLPHPEIPDINPPVPPDPNLNLE